MFKRPGSNLHHTAHRPGWVWRAGFLVLALGTGPVSRVAAQAPNDRSVSDLEPGVDPGIRPGEDFFGFANGAWLKATEIPSGRDRWNARTEIDELARQKIAKLLDDTRAAPAGSLARKVGDFQASYLNETAIEARGIAPLKPLLDSIDRIGDKAGLARLLGGDLGADVDPLNWGIYRSSHLLGLSVEPGLHGEKTPLAILLQGGLGLPDREHYLSSEPGMQDLRTRYREYLGRLLTLAGLDSADQRAHAVMALETALAQTQASREASADDRNVEHRWARADFARQAPGMDWSVFFTAAELGRQDTFVVWQPSAVSGVAALVGSQPLRVWQDYLRLHLLDRYADVLPRAFAQAALELHGTAGSGAPDQRPRAQRASEATQLALTDAVGRLYAERYFPAEQKARVETIVANVITAFRHRLEAVTWMSPATRAQALAKLNTLYFGIGYPARWKDYSGLMVDPGDALGNLRRVADWNYRELLAGLGRRVDMTEWWIAPQRVGAVLVFQQNAYNFPAALLQAPKFDPSAPEAANYGAIGAIVGHEVSHFVDLLGADYDAEGRLHHWWTADDQSRFQLLADALGRQVAGYRPEPELAIDARRTQTENVADLAGLAAAFDAYRGSLGSRTADRDYVRQQDRQFFIGFARSWRGKIREGAMRNVLATDSHAPERYRIAIVRNIDAWYDAFGVRPEEQLYLEPGARVRIW